MIAQRDGPFLNLARLNVEKYARDKTVNRHLFDYVFLHEGDVKTAQQVERGGGKDLSMNNFPNSF